QGLRERTSTELARVNALYQRHVEDKDRYRDAKRAVTSSPVPLSASHDDLSTLVTAIGDAAPGPAKSALTALSALFPVKGTKVTGYLRAGDDQHGPLSMSFQLADLGDPGLGSSFTIAEVVRDTGEGTSPGDSPRLGPPRGAEASLAWRRLLHEVIARFKPALGTFGAAIGRLTGQTPASAAEPVVPPGRPEALALVAVAETYRTAGFLDTARAKYEAAIEKDATLEAAREGLWRLLYGGSPVARAHELAHACAPFLTLMLSRDQLVAQARPSLFDRVRWWFRRRLAPLPHPSWIRAEAVARNWIGGRLADAADTAGSLAPDGYRLALAELDRAIELCPDWYLPYEVAGDTLSLRGKATRLLEDQRASIERYDAALQRVGKGPYLDRAQDPPRSVKEAATTQIHLARAISQLLTLDPRAMANARSTFAKFLSGGQPWARGWRPSEELSGELLYTVGCWYGTEVELNRSDLAARAQAIAFVMRAVARDDRLARLALHDPDLRLVGDGLIEPIARYERLPADERKALKKRYGQAFEEAVARLIAPPRIPGRPTVSLGARRQAYW
nr:hypothetical protein [Chloroflexota bacterium]